MGLLKLELKRVLKSKMTVILLLSALVLTGIMAYLPTTFPYVAYVDSQGQEVKLTGRAASQYVAQLQSDIAGTVTPEKVRKALEDYQACLRKYGVEDTYDLPDGVYTAEILPVAPLLRGVREAFSDPDTGMAPSLMELDPERLEQYYEACDARLVSLMKMEQKDYPAAQQAAIELYDRVEKPYVFVPGYTTDAMDYQILLAFLVMVFCTVIAAPVFTWDYQTGADDILRCTKHGRTQLAVAKIASAVLICTAAFVLCAAAYILVSNSLFGWETTKTSMQLYYSISNLPNLNIRQLQIFTAVSGLASVLATVSFTLLLSSRCRNMVTSLATALGFCVLPLVIYMFIPGEIGIWMYSLLPASGAGLQTSGLYALINFDFLNLGSLALWLPYAMLGANLVEIPLFMGLAVHSYNK